MRLTWLKWLYIVSGQFDKAGSIDVSGALRQSFKGRQLPSFQHQYTLGEYDNVDTTNSMGLKHFTSVQGPSPTCFSSLEIGSVSCSCSHKKQEEKEMEETLPQDNICTTLEENPSFFHKVTVEADSFASQSSEDLPSSAEQDLQHSFPSPLNINASVTDTTTSVTETNGSRPSDRNTELTQDGVVNSRVHSPTPSPV